ncbi:hypothetical protein V6N13_029244 [Hibiscus sabdariffa]|uniref:Uncharacterized protein n=1 Tax=Hibiscus sabdariffa TaxID=183260 RepID=A0ABR2TAJ2_9ROSI
MYLHDNHLVMPSEDDCMPPTGKKFACNSSTFHEQPEKIETSAHTIDATTFAILDQPVNLTTHNMKLHQRCRD